MLNVLAGEIIEKSSELYITMKRVAITYDFLARTPKY